MFAHRPARSPTPRHLVCLDLVRSATRLEGREHSGLERRVAAGRQLLIHARMRGWDITHVHPRSASRASPPVEGLQPLPSERLIYRTGVSAFSNRTFRHAIEAAPQVELVLVSFSLSSSCLATALTAHDWGVPVALASDVALGPTGIPDGLDEIGRLARSIAEPFMRIAAADDLIEVRHGLRLVIDEAGANRAGVSRAAAPILPESQDA